jgi:hypothetical protein
MIVPPRLFKVQPCQGIFILRECSTRSSKEQKGYDTYFFSGLTLTALISYLVSIIIFRPKDTDFLNCNMTDEWRKWMPSEYIG